MPVSSVAEREASQDPPRSLPLPPEGGFTADDLDRIPDLPPHTEMIDGSLVPVTPQRLFHTFVLSHLDRRLYAQTPEHLVICREVTVKIGKRQRPEPDLILAQATAVSSPDQTWFPPHAVELAVEVVSPESELRDRERKPEIYARAGIPHFWLVEEDDGEVVVFVYEQAPNGGWTRPTAHRDRLKLSAPFDIDIDLTKVWPKRR